MRKLKEPDTERSTASCCDKIDGSCGSEHYGNRCEVMRSFPLLEAQDMPDDKVKLCSLDVSKMD